MRFFLVPEDSLPQRGRNVRDMTQRGKTAHMGITWFGFATTAFFGLIGYLGNITAESVLGRFEYL